MFSTTLTWRWVRLPVAAFVLAAALVIPGFSATQARAATPEPCDIYASGGTPCEAAYSTTRALFEAYSGPLYQVQRASDSTFLNVGLESAGGLSTWRQRTPSAPARRAPSPSCTTRAPTPTTWVSRRALRARVAVAGTRAPARTGRTSAPPPRRCRCSSAAAGVRDRLRQVRHRLPRQLRPQPADRLPARRAVRGHVVERHQQPVLLRLRPGRD